MATTIRDVLIKIAVQTDGSKISTPDLRGIENSAKAAGAAAGNRFRDAFNKAVGDLYSKTAGSGGGKGGGGGSGGGPTSKTDVAVEDSVHVRRLRNMKKMLDDQDALRASTERSTKALREQVKAQADHTAGLARGAEAAKGYIANILQLTRGVAMLGSAVGADTSSWLKLASAAQGAMDTLETIGGTVRGVQHNLKTVVGGASRAGSWMAGKFGSMIEGGAGRVGHSMLNEIAETAVGTAGGELVAGGGRRAFQAMRTRGVQSALAAQGFNVAGGGAVRGIAGSGAKWTVSKGGVATGGMMMRGALGLGATAAGSAVGTAATSTTATTALGSLGTAAMGSIALPITAGLSLAAAPFALGWADEQWANSNQEKDMARFGNDGGDFRNAGLRARGHDFHNMQVMQPNRVEYQRHGMFSDLGKGIGNAIKWGWRKTTGIGQAEFDITANQLQSNAGMYEKGLSGAKRLTEEIGKAHGENAKAMMFGDLQDLKYRDQRSNADRATSRLDRFDKGQADLGKRMAALRGQVETAPAQAVMAHADAEQELETAKARIPLLREAIQLLQQESAVLKQNVKLAEEKTEAAKKNLKESELSIGGMSDRDFDIARNLIAKSQRGETFNPLEAEEAARIRPGAFKEDIDRAHEQQNINRGVTETEKAFLTKDKRAELQQAQDEERGAKFAATQIPDIENKITELQAETNKLIDGMKQLFDTEEDLRQKMLAVMEATGTKLEATKAELEALGVKLHGPKE